MLTSEIPNPHAMLPGTSTITPPRVLCSATMPPQQRHERMLKGRVASIDLRIGLNLLGEQGRKLLAEYISIKKQQ